MSRPDRLSPGTAQQQALAATLVQLRTRVDAHFDQALARSPTAFQCAAGCDACCHVRIGVFAVEAVPIREALARLETTDPALRTRVRAQADDPQHQDRCALLVDGRCAVYADRPLICRSHGLPIAVLDPTETSGQLRLDHCPLNFQSETPPRASILRLDAVNQPLAVLASLWSETESAGRSPDFDPRIALADLARAPNDAPRSEK